MTGASQNYVQINRDVLTLFFLKKKLIKFLKTKWQYKLSQNIIFKFYVLKHKIKN